LNNSLDFDLGEWRLPLPNILIRQVPSMNRVGLLMTFVILALLSWRCEAMNASQRAVFAGAKSAFASCGKLQGVHVLQGGNVVCLRGRIDATMFVTLMKVRKQIRQHPYVIVSGPGGYSNSAIDMVRVLNVLEPVPVVGDMCASGCAEVLFLMGNQRVMLHCADVAIHGLPVSYTPAAKKTDRDKEDEIASVWRFKDFYQEHHISLDMVTKPPAAIQKKLDAGEILFWPWSINQLRAFGVKGIISDNDPDRVVPKDYGQVCIKPLPKAAKGTGA
jgi:hypothetical protein